MVLINFSSDKIGFFDVGKKDVLENKGLEKSFPEYLRDFYNAGQPEKFFCLNGPGWFTTLRLVCLSLNVLNFSQEYKIDFYNISKIDFYGFLVQNGFLPSKGVLFIGQRKKCWIYDFRDHNYEFVTFQKVSEELKGSEYFVDQLFGEQKDFFPENIVVDLEISDKGKILISYGSDSRELETSYFPFEKTKILQPNYVMSPNITMKS